MSRLITTLAIPLLLLLLRDVALPQGVTPFPGGASPGDANGITALRSRLLNGFAAGENFATSAAIAGDINGDGYADLIVGACRSNAGWTDAGRAYIFFGGPNLTGTPDVILGGGSAAEYFGFSVAGAGDVNADGYADVIVGAPYADVGGENSGAAYIYLGGPVMNPAQRIVLRGVAAGDEFGTSVAGAGDFNGDGYDDVIVGAPRADATGTDNGMAYLFQGGIVPEGTADRTFTGSNPGDRCGVSVAGVGDMDGDGYEEVIVGAEGATGGSPISGPNAGRATIYFGDSGGTLHRLINLNGSAAYDYFGHAVAGAGDVNGDGYADAIVGAYGNDGAGTDAGRASIYFGGSYVDMIADVTLPGRADGEAAGIAVASTGDLNGDGYDDVIVGAHLNDQGALNAGQARVYCGGARMDPIPDTWLTGTEAGEVLGFSVSGGGDIDGDGNDDYCAGAYRNDGHGVDAGRLYLYFNSLTGEDAPDMAIHGLPGERYGAHVEGIGDVNGDSYDDFAAGTFHSNRYTPEGYLVHIYYGGPLLDTIPDASLYQPVEIMGFGTAVRGAGDLNGDGLADLLIGAPGADDHRGRVYIYLGRPGFVNTPDYVLTGEDSAGYFGESIGAGGDVNGDGYSDFVVGSPRASYGNVYFSGKVTLFLGGPSLGTPYLIIPRIDRNGSFGIHVTMGDINGDGLADVAVASPYPSDTTGKGHVEVFLGHPTDPLGFGWQITNKEVPGNELGSDLAFAGDVNGDGYDDLITKIADYPGAELLLFAGGPAPNVTPAATFRSGPLTWGESTPTAAAGDVNGDGYDDLLIRGDLTTDFGRVLVYFGGVNPDNIADVVLHSLQANDSFGYCVSSAGDVNGDGCADILVAATTTRLPGETTNTYAGAAYLYLSSPPAIVPHLLSAADVPADQGGRIMLQWTRSGYDARGISRVTSYVIERSLPPGKTGFAWEPVGTFQAAHNPRYAFTASTLNDSSANASGTTYFRITAATANPNEYWRSMALSAHSVDNLAPPTPSPLAGTIGVESALLHWGKSQAFDLLGYELFRSTAAGFDPDTLQPVATLTDTSFTDASLPAAPALYYIVRALDVHGNRSGPSNELTLVTVGVAENEQPIPSTFILEQNYPNPFNPSTTIRFGLPTAVFVSLVVYNALGEEVASLVEGEMEAGYHEVRFNAAHLPSGVYFTTLRGGGTYQTRKLILIR